LLFDIQAVRANVPDAIAHAVPFFVAQFVVLFWLSEGRILPIISDLYQTLCATEIMKAVLSGTLWPSGQAFNVTAKGGDRSRRFVQWPMLRIFAGLLALNVLGILYTFLFDRVSAVSDASGIALFWAWYNILILLLACYVCIEQPQRRLRHRFRIDENVCLKPAGAPVQVLRASDISVSGIHLLGTSPLPIGAIATVSLDDFKIRSRVVRFTKTGFALAFDPTLRNRANVVRYIFSRRYPVILQPSHPIRVARALAGRLLR
jgi:cellulose synthase (UDP-forming)